MHQLEPIESICHDHFWNLLLIFYFLAIQDNLYMIHLYLNLFYEDYNGISQHYERKINFLPFFLLILLDIFAKEMQNFFKNFI